MNKNYAVKAFMGLILSTCIHAAQADIYFANSYMDKRVSLAVIGDANALGKTQGFAENIPYSQALKLLLPKWKVLNRLNKYPYKFVTWTKGTDKIEILREMNKRGGVFFYVDQGKKEITIDWKPSKFQR